MSERGALLVLAGAVDASAHAFVERHEAAGAVLLTPRDLSREGWRMHLGNTESAVAVAGGRRFGAHDIRGVLTRLPSVGPEELPHIAGEDRAYVAAEMTAFLLAFLAGLPVRVANPPTPLCLAGPYWRDERWRRVARGLGLEAPPKRRRAVPGSADAPEPGGAVVNVVGDVAIGAPHPKLAQAALALARAAEADLLAVEFEGEAADAGVLRASPLVDLDNPSVEAAALALFGAPAEQHGGRAR